MNRHLGLALFVIATFFTGCNERIGGYIAASSITKDGFAKDTMKMRTVDGQEIKVWGFVDHRNLYGDVGAKEILEGWWSGDGPDAATWRFNLKAKEDDVAGHSFAVHVPNDAGRDGLLEVFLADVRAQRPTRVFVKGRIFAFDAPANFIAGTGLYMKVQSSRDILVRLPEEKSRCASPLS